MKSYYIRKEKGLCVLCGWRKSKKGLTCASCREARKKRDLLKREASREGGLCTYCHKRLPVPGKLKCSFCNERNKL